ncbi:Primase 2 [Syntrophobotulus glycolicus DSM 8271]|uniref:Primase 2 n=1 Tax=Syntrophobotulus glycolicus (strain DSM 8271 / FlGlyR) TaxID=645991 RepID=F0SXE5_SYNGF|nr:AAA family ATPase [Syntrophobotulus glycolicus]ADY54691.1 Primase 2 [Syntrophobotulus glycolicus DSM 8271]
MDDSHNLLDLLKHIDPAQLDYATWLSVGMALKEAGYTAADWDEWSRRDIGRYHAGECFRKWDSFRGASTPVTAGTIVALAKDHGWRPERDIGYELGWDSTIGGKDDLVVIQKGWLEGREVAEPDSWDHVGQLVKYLEILFEASENVGYVTESWEKDGKYLPTKGNWDRTAGELIQQFNKCKDDIGAVLGDYKLEAGAWIRFNPLDGKGCKNENVTEFRYALVESDDMNIDQQNAIIRELELPVACLVHSGGKSLHAITRIDAANYDEYRKRVDYLYTVLKKNGMNVDTQNKNPSRLSRMPGVMRNGHKQFLIDTNIGKESWKDWQEWIEGINDDLPEPESLTSVWDDLPELAPPLIDSVLRQGHKMLMAGPSKAGKSFALIELCCAIAEGRRWFNWPCTQGKVMYVNLELDRASCLHRFRDVYTALGWQPKNLNNIDIWNLRGKSVPMDKLAPKLIRRAAKKNYIAIIIDPIYKVITGDENSADQMAHFCNQFDRVCTDLGAAVIYCHHHSKGSQGNKRSMDRASGSGVFARDPDALLDLIELELNENILKQEENKAIAHVCKEWLNKHVKDWEDHVSQDHLCSEKDMLEACRKLLETETHYAMQKDVEAARKAIKQRTAWRIDGTLREFPKFPPVNLWFNYPIHYVDDVGSLQDIEAEGEAPPWQKATEKRKYRAKKDRRNKAQEFDDAVKSCNMGEPPTINNLIEWFSSTGKTVAERTIRDWIKTFGYEIDRNNGNTIVKKDAGGT